MTEVKFIKTYKEKWQTFEKYLNGHQLLSPDELSDLYIQLTDDLSYARTNYPTSKLVGYLNQLAVQAHQKIYRNKKESGSRFLRLIKEEIPKAAFRHRKQFKYAAIIFITSIFLGLLSSYLNPEFPNQIMGDSYVNMTQQNIEDGDPLAVYKGTEESMMFVSIFANNIRVSFMAFIAGIMGSIPAGLIMVYNGIMVGAFLFFFVRQGLIMIALSTIFLHGAVELTSIVIAGGCGLIIGNSLLFPGTYSRMVSLRKAASDALKVMLGLSPFVLLAALIESYITRHYLEMGVGGRLFVIIPTFIFIIWYFFVYPRKFADYGKAKI